MDKTRMHIDEYVAAWNEPDAEVRGLAVRDLYADDGRIVTGSTEARGLTSILQHIAEVHEIYIAQGQHRFRVTETSYCHDCILLRWELVTSDAREVSNWGLNVLLLQPDGHIGSDYQFRPPEIVQ